MALRRITQETFDAVVKENIEEFDMNPEEALREAVEQFQSQGVDLSCIVQAVPTSVSDEQDEQVHEVLQALESLQVAQTSSGPLDPRVKEELQHFTHQCSLGFAQRHLAAQKQAYPVILSTCLASQRGSGPLLASLTALASLVDGQPDLLDLQGRELLVGVLSAHRDDPEVTCVAVRIVRLCCLKHEQNRQDLVKAGVLALIVDILEQHAARASLVREACLALRVMTFDDDVRVTFGNAHEHAKMIVLEHGGLKVLIEAAKAHPDNTAVLSELCATLSRLAVRNEFCQDICDLGGLKFMMSLLAEGMDSQDLVRQLLSALRAIAGNDDVKDAIVNAGGVELIVIAMNRHVTNAQVCEQGCAALSVLALRKPSNCRVIMDEGGAMAALQAMKTHPQDINVQKQACMVMRNMVARVQQLSLPILEMGAEALIIQALEAHQDCSDVGRAALRDLGCQVELRELWTGKKGSLTN